LLLLLLLLALSSIALKQSLFALRSSSASCSVVRTLYQVTDSRSLVLGGLRFTRLSYREKDVCVHGLDVEN